MFIVTAFGCGGGSASRSSGERPERRGARRTSCGRVDRNAPHLDVFGGLGEAAVEVARLERPAGSGGEHQAVIRPIGSSVSRDRCWSSRRSLRAVMQTSMSGRMTSDASVLVSVTDRRHGGECDRPAGARREPADQHQVQRRPARKSPAVCHRGRTWRKRTVLSPGVRYGAEVPGSTSLSLSTERVCTALRASTRGGTDTRST
jgi:hypothetical protein